MKYAVEMGSGAMIHIQSFLNIGSGIGKLIWGDIHVQAHGAHGDVISLLLFFLNKKSMLKIKVGLRDHLALCLHIPHPLFLLGVL
jgi:hypothetical protein